MLVAKVIMGKKDRFVKVVKTGKVAFDPRPGWVFVQEVDKAHGDVFWVHPAETPFVWVREFSN